jgi:rhodanese-related sulfurtransferase
MPSLIKLLVFRIPVLAFKEGVVRAWFDYSINFDPCNLPGDRASKVWRNAILYAGEIMNRKPYAKSKVKALESQGNSWLWIGSLLVLIAILSLGMSACSSAPAQVSTDVETLPATISIHEANELYEEGVFLLDVRTQEEWDDFHAPDTTLIPLDQLESRLGELPEGEPIVVVCRSGNRSQAGRDILLAKGFEQVTSMEGGLNAWRDAGYPIE